MAWQRIMASGELGETAARLRRYDGEYRWFLFRANPLRDETGNITAQEDETVRPYVLEQGAVECLYKPFSDTALHEALTAAFHGS